MADNVAITAGSGTAIAADDVSGVFYQKVKLDGGGDGLSVPMVAGRSADAASFPVALSTEDVALVGSLTETAPATDTASSGLNGRLQRVAQRLTSIIALLPTALGAGGGIKVDGSGTALPVSGTVAVSTNSELGIVTETAPATDTASSGLNGRLQRIAQRLTSLIALLPSALVGGRLDINVGSFGGTAVVNGGLAGSQSVGGTVANNVAPTGNPIPLAGIAISSEPTANTATRISQLLTDLVGKLIVLPYANPENFVSGAITSAMTGTTSTSLMAAPAAGLRNYITTIIVSNAHATVGTDIIIQDGSGGTTLMTIPAAAVYGGAVITLPTPLRQPTTATAIYCANVTTGASTKVSVVGYKGV